MNRSQEACIRESPRLAHEAAAPARNGQTPSIVASLARFFPDASPLRMRVQFARILPGTSAAAAIFGEIVVIEFGTAREVLFECNTPLEFAEDLRLRNSDGSFDARANVVAVQYHEEKTVVAARFRDPVPNWIVKS